MVRTSGDGGERSDGAEMAMEAHKVQMQGQQRIHMPDGGKSRSGVQDVQGPVKVDPKMRRGVSRVTGQSARSINGFQLRRAIWMISRCR